MTAGLEDPMDFLQHRLGVREPVQKPYQYGRGDALVFEGEPAHVGPKVARRRSRGGPAGGQPVEHGPVGVDADVLLSESLESRGQSTSSRPYLENPPRIDVRE